jgi:predicted ATPase/class 3 adenylate cyclase
MATLDVFDSPTPGAVTLMMTDMEGSTHWIHELGAEFSSVVERHHELIDDAVSANRGKVVDATGDSHFSVFGSAGDAVLAAAEIGGRFERESWPSNARIRVRAGLHSGTPRLTRQRYVGLDVHRTARICSAGHGGQVLLSGSTSALLQAISLPPGMHLREIGTCRLKDLRHPENLWELVVPGLPDRFPPVRGTQPSNLQPQSGPCIGREVEQSRIVQLLHGDARLVTLTGPGGVGKTRLAMEVAHSCLPKFKDGVFAVSLESVVDPALVIPTIAEVIGIPEIPGKSVLDSIKHHLCDARVLLVLDNFEQVLDAAATVAEVLASCNHSRAIVTSRSPLGVRFEQEFPVPTLGLVSTVDSQADVYSDSVQLFLLRVREFLPEYTPNRADIETIEEICRRLDGLPLAIELAASRIRILSPRALLERLKSGVAVLSGTRRDAAHRHQALLATIVWSYQLLTNEEQKLFRALSVFAGGFSVEAAEAVWAGSGDVLDQLGLLVQKSLLRVEELNADTRFRMLHVIRDFGMSALEESDEWHAIRTRHAQYYLALAEEQATLILSLHRRRALACLLPEADNLRLAFHWGLTQPDGVLTARFLQALLWLRISQGQFAEGQNWTERGLAQAVNLGATNNAALIFDAAGWLALFSGDYESSLPHTEKALDLFLGLGLKKEIARSKVSAGIARAVTGDERGPALLVQSLAEHQALNDSYGAALSFTALGEGARMAGDHAAARECYESAITLYEQVGNVYWTAALKHNLAHSYLHERDWSTAVPLLADLLSVAREFDFPMMLGHYLGAMGGVAVVRGRFELAAQLFGALDMLLTKIGASFEPADQAELDRHSEAAKLQLGEAVYDSAYQAGRALSSDQAIAQTLSLRQ